MPIHEYERPLYYHQAAFVLIVSNSSHVHVLHSCHVIFYNRIERTFICITLDIKCPS